MSKEIELKMVVLPAGIETALPELLRKLNAKDVKETLLINTYFDTPDVQLNKSRIALRIRQKEGRFIQTLKTKGVSVAGLHQRGEWEWEILGNKLDATLLSGGVWPDEVSVDELIPFFETNFKRTSAVIEWCGAKIELAVDCGCIKSGENRVPLSEVELEIIEGDAGRLFEVAEVIAGILPVMPSDVSKAEQGYRLGGEVVEKEFSYPLNCTDDYKLYVKGLVARNLSYWLYLFDLAGQDCSVRILREMQERVVILRELLLTQEDINRKAIFSSRELFDIEIERLSSLIGCLAHGRVEQKEVYSKLLSAKEAGMLAIQIGRWLARV